MITPTLDNRIFIIESRCICLRTKQQKTPIGKLQN